MAFFGPEAQWQVVGYCLIPLEAFRPIERVCKMSFKAKGCNGCRMRSCCDLAERNARLYQQGKVTTERFEEHLRDCCDLPGLANEKQFAFNQRRLGRQPEAEPSQTLSYKIQRQETSATAMLGFSLTSSSARSVCFSDTSSFIVSE